MSEPLAAPRDASPSTPSYRGALKRALILLALLTLVAAAIHERVPLCPSAALFGLPCPGCGLTRATLHGLHGDWAAAFHVHPLFWLLAPLYFGALGAAALGFVFGPVLGQRFALPRGFWTRPWLTRVGAAVLLLTLGVWASRFFGAFGGPVSVQRLVPPSALSQPLKR